MHAGIVGVNESAIIRVIRENETDTFPSTTANGATSELVHSWPRKYTLEKVSDCVTAAPTVPGAPANLVSSANPSADGSFDLSWDAPTGTTPTGYLVYRSGSKSGYLSKTFADRTLSITGLSNGSYAYKVFACTGTVASPDCGPAANITVTVEIPDNDNDGIPDATDPDDDNDGMTDVWEMENGLNSLNASDATLDADNDNHNNLAEFNAGSDPNWNLSKPGSIPVLAAGFNNSYTVQRGLVNSDQLQDLLIQDPTSGILPAVSKFVLIQQAEGGFSMESTDAHTLPSASQLTSIDQVIQLHDLNADGVTDMLLFELDEHIDGAKDQIIYANYDDLYTVPNKHVGVSDKLYKFFEQVSGWINDEDYFQDNARQVMVPELDSVSFLYNSDGDLFTGENSDETQTRTECTSDVCFDDDLECTGFTLAPIFCVVVYGDIGDIGGLGASGNPCSVVAFSCGYGTDTYDVGVEDAHDDPNQANVYAVVEVEFHDTSTIAVPDYSGFDPKALDLVTELFAPVRDAGTIVPGSVEAIEIASTLEGYLKTTIFAGGLETEDSGVFPEIGEYSSYVKIVRDILKVFEYVLGRITPPCNSDNPDSCDRTSPPIILPPPVCTPTFELAEYQISTTPSMPTINLAISNFSALPQGATISWEAQVEYTPSGNGCSGGPSFDSDVITGQGANFSPNFGGFFGGNLTVTASCSAPSFRDGSTEKTSSITGTVPSDATLAAAIPSQSSPFEPADLRRIACKESNFTHFLPNGLPKVGTGGGGGDAGLMQICYNREAEHFWNFRSNISYGRKILTGSRDALGFARSWLADVIQVAADDGHQLTLTNDHYRKEAIHRYNAGTGESIDAYWEWDSELDKLSIVARGGDPGYLARILHECAELASASWFSHLAAPQSFDSAVT